MPNSRELATFLVTITGVAGMSALAGWMWPRSAQLLRDGLTVDRRAIFDPSAMFAILIDRIVDGLMLRAGVFNILDKKYAWWSDVRGLASTSTVTDAYTQPGRNASVSLSFRF